MLPQFTPSDLARFWSKVDKSGQCWIWTAEAVGGYGRLRVRFSRRVYRMVMATHISYSLAHGPIAPGLFVLHNCPDGDNPACVNPAHLWLGTTAENSADMVSKHRHAIGSQKTFAKLTEPLVAEARIRHSRGEAIAVLAADYGVVGHTMWLAVSGRTWRHVSLAGE